MVLNKIFLLLLMDLALIIPEFISSNPIEIKTSKALEKK